MIDGEEMKRFNSRVLISITFLALVSALHAQDAEQPAYLNRALSPEQRAADLVSRMTVEEKVSQLVNQSRAVPRLNVPDYDWWSESLHGVARNGTTEFPEPVGLAATFDGPGWSETACMIAGEMTGAQKHRLAKREAEKWIASVAHDAVRWAELTWRTAERPGPVALLRA
jgi:beta-glucosidase